MDSGTLQWPGLWDLKTYVVDEKTSKVYSKSKPLPPQKQHLDTMHNRYVRLSEVLNLFADNTRDEAEWMLREIQKSYNIGSIVHVTVTAKKSSTECCQVERKVTSYISVAALMVFAILWPYCKPFQVSLDHFCGILLTVETE